MAGCTPGKRGLPSTANCRPKHSKLISLSVPAGVLQDRPSGCCGPLCLPKASAAQQTTQPRGDINLRGTARGFSSNFDARRFHLSQCPPSGWVCSGAQWPLRPHCGRIKPKDTRPRAGTAAVQTSPAPPSPPAAVMRKGPLQPAILGRTGRDGATSQRGGGRARTRTATATTPTPTARRARPTPAAGRMRRSAPAGSGSAGSGQCRGAVGGGGRAVA